MLFNQLLCYILSDSTAFFSFWICDNYCWITSIIDFSICHTSSSPFTILVRVRESDSNFTFLYWKDPITLTIYLIASASMLDPNLVTAIAPAHITCPFSFLLNHLTPLLFLVWCHDPFVLHFSQFVSWGFQTAWCLLW